MKNLFKNIFGDLTTTSFGAGLGIPTIVEGINTLPTDKPTAIGKLLIGVGTLLLGLLSTAKSHKSE